MGHLAMYTKSASGSTNLSNTLVMNVQLGLQTNMVEQGSTLTLIEYVVTL